MPDIASPQPVSAIAIYEERIRHLKALRDILAEGILSASGEDASRQNRQFGLIEKKIAIYEEEIAILKRLRAKGGE